MRVLNMYRAMGETHPVTAPSLEVGDVLVFTKCTVHTCSGSNTLGRPRHAWQIRLFTEPQLFERPYDSWPGFGEKFEKYGKYIEGPKYIRLWPNTLASEVYIMCIMYMVLKSASGCREA